MKLPRLHSSLKYICCLSSVALALDPEPGHAQRASENVLNAAQDAFGTSIGSESIGLYTAMDARGFNPSQAGNLRIEGMYYQPAPNMTPSPRLFRQTTMRVGLSAQSYPFPSPTGIADYSLRVPGDESTISSVVRLGPYETVDAEFDAQIPILPERFSVNVGLAGEREITDHGDTQYEWTGTLIGRLRLGSVEIIPFWDRTQPYSNNGPPTLFINGTSLPPKFKRGSRIGEPWAGANPMTTTFGYVSSAQWSDWRIQTSLIRSIRDRPELLGLIYTNIQPDFSADSTVQVFPPAVGRSDSGEVKASRAFAEGDRRHVLYLDARGRITNSDAGGTSRIPNGPVFINIPNHRPRPTGYVWNATSNDTSRLGSLGTSYQLTWRNVGEFSAGLQRVFYNREIESPASETSESNWLYNTTLSLTATEKLAVYGSYTRGFEESRVAPPSSINANENVPAALTWQVDAGLRYLLGPVRLTAGAFKIVKPFNDVGPGNIYGPLGTISHEGIEVSATGQVSEALRVVAGGVLLKARLSGILVENGTIGRVPAGAEAFTGTLNLQYGPRTWNGFSLDGRLTYTSDYYMDIANTFRGEAIALLDAGARYRFSVSDTPVTLRFQVLNLFNIYEWRSSGQGTVNFTPPRRYTFQVSADF